MAFSNVIVKAQIVILVTLLAILGLAPVVQAADIGPEAANANIAVNPSLPSYISNDGTGKQEVTWTVSYTSTPVRYTVQIFDPNGNTIPHNTAEVVVNSVSAGTATKYNDRIEVTNLPPPPVPEANPLKGMITWSVPKGWTPAGAPLYTAWVKYYSVEAGSVPEGQAQQTFRVDQVTGTLKIHKYNDLDKDGQLDAVEPELAGWHVEVTGPESFGADTPVSRIVLAGNYQVTETLQADWTCSDPGASLKKSVTVPVGGTGEVYFGNYSIAKTKLIIFKYNDLDKDGQLDAGEPGLSAWHFSVTGPDPFEDDTNALGYITHEVAAGGTYQVTEILKTLWTCSDPGPSLKKSVNVPEGGTNQVNFGNYTTTTPPTLSQWGMIVMAVVFTGSLAWLVKRRVAAGVRR